MPAPTTLSVRRAAERQVVSDPFADTDTTSGPEGEEHTAWHPVTEQSLLAALALLSTSA